jgi:hypothetical protein
MTPYSLHPTGAAAAVKGKGGRGGVALMGKALQVLIRANLRTLISLGSFVAELDGGTGGA